MLYALVSVVTHALLKGMQIENFTNVLIDESIPVEAKILNDETKRYNRRTFLNLSLPVTRSLSSQLVQSATPHAVFAENYPGVSL
jgi:hypothetical protein